MFRGIVRVAALAAVLCCVPALAAAAPPSPTWDHASFVDRGGTTALAYDGKPFFIYGASFFYERIPPSQWNASLARLKALGVNTLDLYVPWNWHELADGDFDFDGRTSPRRNLHALIELIRLYDFKVIVRPGPVIRNEWRNGGYPAWLLDRPEYGMPQHDLLEGRYPPTATLQNQNSDDAAAAWMRNATHLKYATRWLDRALHEFDPIADLVVGVALDDDQGAYLDNQTWPAPHLTQYLQLLEATVHRATGPKLHCFINSYQMKVTASSPVWTMANWYQSDAYAIGEHDRTQLEFTTALLQTRPAQPSILSEFQAGWLAPPDDIAPRAADPANTTLAFATALSTGVRGVVNFPLQDTLNPAGWEAPFANAFYGWDAALRAGYQSDTIFDGVPDDVPTSGPAGAAATPVDPRSLATFTNARYAPTARFGAFVSEFGSALAGTHPLDDVAIAYLTSAYDERSLSNADVGAIAGRTLDAERICDGAGLACRLTDLRLGDDRTLAQTRVLVLPTGADARFAPSRFVAAATARLRRFVAGGGIVLRAQGPLDPAAVRGALAKAGSTPVVDGVPGARFARSYDGAELGFLTVPNYSNETVEYPGGTLTVDGTSLALPIFKIAARDALITPIQLRLRTISSAFSANDRLIAADCPATYERDPAGGALARVAPHAEPCSFNFDIGDSNVQKFERPNAGPDYDRVAISPAGVVRDLPSETPSPAPRKPLGGFVPLRPGEVIAAKSTAFAPPAPALKKGQSPPRLAPNGIPYGSSFAYRSDVYEEGRESLVLQNALVRVVVLPDAGARAFAFEDASVHRNIFTTVGAMRDDVAIEPPLSNVDKIAKYTHQFPAGTFNRPYDVQVIQTAERARARVSYAMPDATPKPIRFERTLELDPDVRYFSCDERTDVDAAGAQRAVSVTSLALGDGKSDIAQTIVFAPEAAPFAANTERDVPGDVLGYYDPATRDLAVIAWRDGDVARAQIAEKGASIVVRLSLAPGKIAHTIYGYDTAANAEAVRARLAAASALANKPPLP